MFHYQCFLKITPSNLQNKNNLASETKQGVCDMRFSLCFLILCALSGCSENCIISPKPVTDTKLCNQSNNLQKEKKCLVQVFADRTETDAGLMVQQGETYRIEAIKENTWCDASRKNVALCGEDGTTLMNIFSPLKRVENSLWFSVIAEVKRTKNDKEQRSSQYDLCNTPKFEISTSGRLVLYPNDATGRYSNNSGAIWLQIERLKKQND